MGHGGRRNLHPTPHTYPYPTLPYTYPALPYTYPTLPYPTLPLSGARRAEDPQVSGPAEASGEPPHVVGCMEEEEGSAGSSSSPMRTSEPLAARRMSTGAVQNT